MDFLTNDNKVGLSYEGFFVQNAQKHIETLLEEQVPNIGINEITKLFINNLVETDKEKNIERKRQREEDKSRREHNIYTNDNMLNECVLETALELIEKERYYGETGNPLKWSNRIRDIKFKYEKTDAKKSKKKKKSN